MTEIVSKADLIGRTALVTGSSRGIGLAVALELAAAGAQVAVHGRSAHGAADVAARLSTHGRHAGTFPADFAEQHAAERFVANVTASLPALAGAAAKWDFQRKLAALLAVDVAATMTLTRGFGRWIADRDGGSIVTIGWDQAAVGMEGDSGELFAAAKGAVMAFTKSASRSLGPKVRVNCVAPGWIKTAWGEHASEAWQRRAVRESMLGRWGTPEDIAHAVHVLVSPATAFVTGQVLPVNGGFRRA